MLDFLKNLLDSAVKALRRALSSKEAQKAREYLNVINDLLPYAANAIQIVSLVTGNKTGLEIAGALRKFEVALEIPVDREWTETEKKTALFALGGAVLRGELERAVQGAGALGITVGGAAIKSHTDIPDNWIDSAVQTSFGFNKNVVEAK